MNEAPSPGVDLQRWNTLRLPARAQYAAQVHSEDELVALSDWAQRRGLPLLPLGQGSNVILAGDIPGLVLRLALRGIEARERGEQVELEVAAGENWHALVQHCLRRGWHGLENLTLIPGLAGAAPVQNIGAYGVELSDVLYAVRGWDRRRRRFVTLSAAECALGYRDSLFKRELREDFIITRLSLRLSTRFDPVLSYPALVQALAGESRPDAYTLEAAVRTLRQSKLPDPARLPNAGSLFKNPVLSAADFAALRARYPDLPGFSLVKGGAKSEVKGEAQEEESRQGAALKIPAAWLLDRAGWKGRRQGGVGMHEHQALVLVHHGGARGAEALAFVARIQRDIASRFGVELEVEPRIYPVPGSVPVPASGAAATDHPADTAVSGHGPGVS